MKKKKPQKKAIPSQFEIEAPLSKDFDFQAMDQPDKSGDLEAMYLRNQPTTKERQAEWKKDERNQYFWRDTGMFLEIAAPTRTRITDNFGLQFGNITFAFFDAFKFETTLTHIEQRIANDILACMTPDQRANWSSDTEIPEFELYGWRRSLLHAWITVKKLRRALIAEKQNMVLHLSIQLGQLLSEYELRRNFESAVARCKRQLDDLKTGNEATRKAAQEKKINAVVELLRRIEENPHTTKTSHLKAMARQNTWGAIRKLTEYCKEVVHNARPTN